MEDERNYYIKLSLILIVISLILIFKFVFEAIQSYELGPLIFDLLALIWPFIGISTAIEFFMKDKWGWGGILFHIFILYCGFYYAILLIISLFNFILEIGFMLKFCLHLLIVFLGWFGFLLYYD